jgi:PIN domain nuclease of toxin-antitoxin system
MDLILDTCALLSLADLAKKKLKRPTLRLIASSNTLYISACSLFEIALKARWGLLQVAPVKSTTAFWEATISRYECTVLPVEADDFSRAANLPDHHNDPLDRIIVARAIRTNSEVVSYDRKLAAYGIALHE